MLCYMYIMSLFHYIMLCYIYNLYVIYLIYQYIIYNLIFRIYLLFQISYLVKVTPKLSFISLFLYLCVNRMFATKGTEFSQFQSTRCIVSILLSNISRNTS